MCWFIQYAVVSRPPKPLNWRTIFFGHPLPTHVFTESFIFRVLCLAGELMECHGLVKRHSCSCSHAHKFWENNPNNPAVCYNTLCLTVCNCRQISSNIHALSVEHVDLVLWNIKHFSIMFKTAFLTSQGTLHFEATILWDIQCSVIDLFPCVCETSEQIYHMTWCQKSVDHYLNNSYS